MVQEKEVKFYCYTEDIDSKGFDIYINGVKINENLKYHVNNFQFVWLCLPGKYNIKVVQKHFLNSRLWFLNAVFSMIAMLLAGYYEEINLKGPFYSIQEGELLIKDNAILKIKLEKSDILFKLIFDEITNYGFFIEPKSNCSYNFKKEEIIVTSKLRRRFIISVLFPISIVFLFITILLILSGTIFFQKGSLVGGILFGLTVILLFIMYIRIAKNILKVAFSRKI